MHSGAAVAILLACRRPAAGAAPGSRGRGIAARRREKGEAEGS